MRKVTYFLLHLENMEKEATIFGEKINMDDRLPHTRLKIHPNFATIYRRFIC